MPDLSVDVSGLRTLSGTLRSVRGALDATRSVVEAGREEVGSDEVYDALDSFESSWDDGRGQINENLQAMTEILDESADAYEQTDTELSDGLRDQLAGGS
ncbi:MAG TPA: type VII secretion target [Marmoricola sp.]|nr:type VII secretion target [Marmoricola sp.]